MVPLDPRLRHVAFSHEYADLDACRQLRDRSGSGLQRMQVKLLVGHGRAGPGTHRTNAPPRRPRRPSCGPRRRRARVRALPGPDLPAWAGGCLRYRDGRTDRRGRRHETLRAAGSRTCVDALGHQPHGQDHALGRERCVHGAEEEQITDAEPMISATWLTRSCPARSRILRSRD